MIKKIAKYGAKILQLPFIVIAIGISAEIKGFFADIAATKPSDSDINAILGKSNKFGAIIF